MSRAFVTENDSWDYCTKAGDTCLFAERGRECKRKDCEFIPKSDEDTGGDEGGEDE